MINRVAPFCYSGGESIHRTFNNLHHSHASLNDQAKRLLSMLKRHHLDVYPDVKNQDLKPTVATRGPYKKAKKSTEQEHAN